MRHMETYVGQSMASWDCGIRRSEVIHDVCVIFLLLLSPSRLAATPKLHQQEVFCLVAVIALKEIAKKFGKTDWDFSKDPCSGIESWSPKIPRKSFKTTATCDCSFDNNATCHITAMFSSYSGGWGGGGFPHR
nr:probable LRR receptor-like serine/threonine-protein kinase At1g07650 [Ipomoea batatas]